MTGLCEDVKNRRVPDKFGMSSAFIRCLLLQEGSSIVELRQRFFTLRI
jgi:hypothetical protein